MATSDTTYADLARERINILGMSFAANDSTTLLASIEYQYKPRDTPHTWHKIVIPISDDRLVLKTILETVKQTKAELEK